VTAPPASFPATRRGRLTLVLLCAVQFLDVVDSSIMNVALPSIRRDLGFSAQGLQWVLSGYLVTYGGLLLLGGRAGDLLGRRPLLVAGTALFAACSLAGGLAVNAGMLVGARLGQGVGAAMMAPVTAGIVVATGVSSRLFARVGTRPVIVAGALIAAAGVWYLSRIPAHGTYPASLLPGLVIMAAGIGAVLVSVTTAAPAGVPADKAGLAAGLLNASQQLGTAFGLAIFSATARTGRLLAAHPRDAALTAGFHRALLACAIFLLAAAVIALRATNSRGEPVPPSGTHAAPGQVPAPELADPPSSAATPRRPAANR
jgi:MFS family permease